MSARQASAAVQVTDQMIEGGTAVYDVWEEANIIDDLSKASDYAKRELVRNVFKAMAAASRACESQGI